MAYLSYLLAAPEHVKELHVFGAARNSVGRYSGLWGNLHRQIVAVTRAGVARSVGASWLWTVSHLWMNGHLNLRTVTGDFSMEDLLLCSGCYLQCQAEAAAIMRSVGALYQHALFVQALCDFRSTRSNLRDAGGTIPVPSRVARGLEFHDVSFRYQTADPWILRHCSFRVGVRETVALVGSTGARKTTLVSLLCRLYDPVEGAATLDGVDIQRFDVEESRRLIGVLFHDFSQYQMRARSNIGVGCMRQLDSLGRVTAAAAVSGADDSIRRLPNACDTVLGRAFSQRTELSRGQWQELAIARSVVSEAPNVVLDELSAWLDAASEDRLLDEWGRLVRDSLCLLVSH